MHIGEAAMRDGEEPESLGIDLQSSSILQSSEELETTLCKTNKRVEVKVFLCLFQCTWCLDEGYKVSEQKVFKNKITTLYRSTLFLHRTSILYSNMWTKSKFFWTSSSILHVFFKPSLTPDEAHV